MKSPSECSNINDIREAIDELDRQIISLLANRYGYVKEIVKYKDPDRDSIVAKERYLKVLKERRKLAKENGLNPDIIEDIYRQLINHFIEEELKLVNNSKNNSE
jgi:isochorismate pyruvate lyase